MRAGFDPALEFGSNCWLFVIAAKSESGHPDDMRTVVVVTFPDGQILDVTGPLEVFAATSRYLQETAKSKEAYRVELAALETGPVCMSNGIALIATRAIQRVRGDLDTLIVAGGFGSHRAKDDPRLQRSLQRLAPRTRRLASVCTGAFCLAAAGLLDGRTATTHWSACERLARDYPRVSVETNAIFTRDGKVWSSAGVTAGMDMALAMVEDDWGHDVAVTVARHLVMFLKRPGGQAQFSATLQAQQAQRDGLRDLPAWIADHLDRDLTVFELARRSGMSERNFARAFVQEIGESPARFVEQARIEAARRQLEETRDGIDEVASACGFGTSETMRRAFHRRLKVGPRQYRERFRSPGRSRA